MKITRIEMVISFKIEPSIVLVCGSALKRIQNMLGGRLFTVNAPDDSSPTLPRAILKLDDTILNIALDRFQITTIPPSHIADDQKKSSRFAIQRARTIIKELLDCMPQYQWAGVILEIEYPEDPSVNKTTNDTAIPIFDKLIKIDRKGNELSAFQLQFGFKDITKFTTYTISTFEGGEVEIPDPQPAGYFPVEPSDLPLIARGIRLIVDINNKPKRSIASPMVDLEEIFSEQEKSFETLPQALNLEGVLA